MKHTKKLHSMWKGGLVVFMLAFLLNFVWESVHAVLFYEGHAEYTAGFFTRMVLYASFVDALLILGMFCAGCLLFRTVCWLENYKGKEVLFTIILGTIIAIVIEIKALVLNQWTYSKLMPTIFGIGLSPLVQLAVTGSLSIFLTAKFFYGRKHR